MQVIFRQYGSAILSVITGSLIILLVMTGIRGKGIFPALREKADASISLPAGEEESKETAETVMEAGSPEVMAVSGLMEGTEYEPEAICQTGRVKTLRILKVSDFSGQDCSSDCLQADGKVSFPADGVYKIRYWCEDEEGRAGAEEIWLGIRPKKGKAKG